MYATVDARGCGGCALVVGGAGGVGGDAMCAALYAGGCGGWALHAGGIGRVGDARHAGGDAICGNLYDTTRNVSSDTVIEVETYVRNDYRRYLWSRWSSSIWKNSWVGMMDRQYGTAADRNQTVSKLVGCAI